MRPRQISAGSTRTRPLIATFLCLGLLFALGLAAAPQLHQWLHQIGHPGNHECAATLMSSGSVEHSACEPPPVQPCKVPGTPIFRTQLFGRVIASLAFLRLEHAPPAAH